MGYDNMSKGLFVIGTGTDIGKTYVTGLLLKYIRDNGYDATYFKAALSGAIRDENDNLIPGDAVEVLRMADLEEDTDFLVPYIYETAVSPHLASRIEGNPVNLKTVKEAYEKVSQKYDYIVVNDDLDDCVREINGIVETEEGGVSLDPKFKTRFLSELLEIIDERMQAARARLAAERSHRK